MENTSALPATSLLQLNRIVRTKYRRKNPDLSAPRPLIDMSESAWWDGVKSGRFPAPIYLGDASRPYWRADKIQLVLEGRYEPEPGTPAHERMIAKRAA
jgi:prophage regulatory protein